MLLRMLLHHYLVSHGRMVSRMVPLMHLLPSTWVDGIIIGIDLHPIQDAHSVRVEGPSIPLRIATLPPRQVDHTAAATAHTHPEDDGANRVANPFGIIIFIAAVPSRGVL